VNQYGGDEAEQPPQRQAVPIPLAQPFSSFWLFRRTKTAIAISFLLGIRSVADDLAK